MDGTAVIPHVGGLDVERARADTPSCASRAHFDNAGASLMPRPVVDAVIGHVRREARIGGYAAAREAAKLLDAVYRDAARLLNCEPAEIALFENATRAFNAVLYAMRFASGDRVLTSRAEYCSHYMAYLHLARTTGVEIVLVPDDAFGQIDVDELARRIDERVRLVSMVHVPTSDGRVNPVAEVGRVARAAGVPFLLDACQSVGQVPVDVREIGCDFLSTTGRKYLRGPRGTGLLYVRRPWIEALHPVTLDLGGAEWSAVEEYALRDDARRFETFEASHALRLGLGAAIRYALELGSEAIYARVTALGELLRDRLARVPGVVLHDPGKLRCGIVGFSVDGIAADQARAALAAARVGVGVTVAQGARLFLEERGLDQMLRASVHYYNTEQEIVRLCDVLRGLGGAPGA